MKLQHVLLLFLSFTLCHAIENDDKVLRTTTTTTSSSIFQRSFDGWLEFAGEPQMKSDTLVVRVPVGADSVDSLIQSIAQGIGFPGHHAANWNALFDTLCTLSWVPEREVVIAHESTPRLSVEQLAEYRKVLADAVDSWRVQPGDHVLRIEWNS